MSEEDHLEYFPIPGKKIARYKAIKISEQHAYKGVQLEYPKINSLYKREGCGPYDEEKHRYECDIQKKTRKSALILGDYACEEFRNITQWTVTEKVDGTNIRIMYERDQELGTSSLRFGGRTSNAQIPADLYAHLQDTFTLEKMASIFPEAQSVCLYGEGYGPKIQSGGYYSADMSFILFDAVINGWWLTRISVLEIAQLLKIEEVPLLCDEFLTDFNKTLWTTHEIEEYIKMEPVSKVAKVQSHAMEGIVARSEPLMLFRSGLPIMFKLKCKDFT